MTARQLTTALVPTVPSPVQSTTIAKVREKFWHHICPYLLCDRRVVVRGRQLGQPWLGPGLVRVVPGLLDSSLQSPGHEKHLVL